MYTSAARARANEQHAWYRDEHWAVRAFVVDTRSIIMELEYRILLANFDNLTCGFRQKAKEHDETGNVNFVCVRP